jgi:hypothetical protein
MANSAAALEKARRWAERVACNQSKRDKQRCVRRTLDALYSILPPKPDGTHPLDADKFKLEG